MKVLVHRKGLYTIFFVLFFLFTGFSFAANTKDKHYISPEDYYASNSSSWLRMYYEGDLSNLYGKEIDRLKAAYDTLSSSDNYHEINFQFLEIPHFRGEDIFLYGYEEGHADDAINKYEDLVISNVKTAQLSTNCLSRFNLSLWKGEFFESEDYSNGDILPILLGYEYKDTFSVGDEIKGKFIAKPFKFKVIGILNKDSNIMISGTPLYLDRYIVMPSIDCLYTPTSQDEDLFQVRHYVNKLEGWFEYNNISDLKIFSNKIASINKALPGKIESSLLEQSPIVTSVFSSILKIKQAALWACIFLAIIISILCPLFYFRLQVKSISLLCLNIISGIDYKKILIKSIFLFLFILVLSNIVTYAILLLMGINFPTMIIVIDFFAVTTVVLLNSLFLKQSKLILYMGGADLVANTKHF